jgi:hypothetical protein
MHPVLWAVIGVTSDNRIPKCPEAVQRLQRFYEKSRTRARMCGPFSTVVVLCREKAVKSVLPHVRT